MCFAPHPAPPPPLSSLTAHRPLLDTAAIHILSGLLSDTTTAASLRPQKTFAPHDKPKPNPIRVPPPSQIALLTTLIIHPSFTTRPPETNNLHIASHAHTYLRGLLGTVGAVNANFRAAFDFTPTPTASSATTTPHANNTSSTRTTTTANGRRARSNSTTSTASTTSSDADVLSGAFARSQLVFRRAADFWAVLGWAFRCAAEHPHRWRCWRVWLEFVVGVLEADFDERLARDQREEEDGGYPALAGALVVGYVEVLRRERRNVVGQVLRGVFAFSDGENAASDRAVFQEVFEREAVVGVKSKRKRGGEAAVVDLENDRFGDYLDGEEEVEEDDEEGEAEDDEEPATPWPQKGRRSKGKGKAATTPSFTLTDDIAETVPFRLRIFRLLSGVSYYLPSAFAPADELYERFTHHVRGLPLPMFQLFVSSRPPLLPEDVQVLLLREVLDAMLPRHPDPADVDPDHGAGSDVSVLVLERCFLPFAANRVTAEDNAKLSITLESLLWFYYARIGVEDAEGLRGAVEKGIKAREDRIKRRGAGKADAADKAAREALARSARNLRALVDVVEVGGV